MTDFAPWSELRLRSRDFLQPWEPSWPSDDLTRSAFRRRIAAYSRDIDLDQAYPFFIFSARDELLLGGVTISNVRRGVAQMASIGYWVGDPAPARDLLAAVRAIAPLRVPAAGPAPAGGGLHPEERALARITAESGLPAGRPKPVLI